MNDESRMKFSSIARIVSVVFTVLFFTRTPFLPAATAFNVPQSSLVALMPLEIRGITVEEAELLRIEFLKSLRSTGRFEIMSDDTMAAILKEADFKNLGECSYSHCIADVGKVLGVEKMFQVAITRRGRLYTIRVRAINSSNAEVLHDATREHSGEFDPLLTSVLPEMAQEVQQARLESWEKYKWYVVGGAVLVLATTIYFINKSLSKRANSDFPGQGNPDPSN